jgi:hypothetical protein
MHVEPVAVQQVLHVIEMEFVVLNRMCHAMGKLSFILVRFSSGRGTEVARIRMNRRVMAGIGTSTPLPPMARGSVQVPRMCGNVMPAKPSPRPHGLADSRKPGRIVGRDQGS